MNEGHEDRPARQEGGNGKDKKKRSLSRSRAGKMSTPVLSLNPPQASQGKPSKSVDTVMLGTTEPKMQPAKNTANRNAKSFGNIPQVASAATEPSPKQSLQRRSSLRSDRSLERNAGGMRSTSPSFQQLSAIQETGVPLSPKTVRRPSMPTEVKEDFSISTSSVDLNISITRHVKSTPNLKNQAKTDGRKASSGGPTRNHSVRQASAGSSTDSVSPPSRARDAWGNAPVPIRRRSQDRGATTPGRRPSYDGAAIPATVPEVARSGKPGYGKKAADKIPYGLKQDGLSQSLTHPPDRIKEPWVDDKVDVASIGSAEALLPNENHPAEKLKDFVPKKVRSDPKQRNRGGNL
ncbi:hypothetical protein BC829DRAFT_33616 [Chytridium lagenaria]|nr:hypothetical protein BC829DRAFT_33616 [Chytridium lagenaria]